MLGGFRRNPAFRKPKGAAQLADKLFFIRLVAVQFEAEFGQPCFFQLVVNHVQRGEFFGDEQHLFTVGKALGDYVGYSLAFARSGRTLKHEALPRLGKRDRLRLTRVGVDHVLQFGDCALGRGFNFAPFAEKNFNVFVH